IVVRALQTQLAPATAMAQWLQEREPPPRFSIDRERVLQQPDSERSGVRYARHTLEIEEIGEHIRSSKVPTQLAMTWAGRVSFVLTGGLALRRVTLLDGVLDGAPTESGVERFDADVAILTGELRGLIPDLVAALGGALSRP